MALGNGTNPVLPSLPKVDFEIIKSADGNKRFGVNDAQARSYGFNDYSDEFVRPDHYIRYIEPLESDLAQQVEYDMDEQDQEWLESINSERKKEQLDRIAPEMFEVIMDRLEKEWFDLTKNIPKHDFALPSEDSTCAICDDSEGENSNAIVFCDGCNLAVHQDCYGVPYIPEGQWLCRKCTVSPQGPVTCMLCPNEGGAFKQTDTGDWVHLLCAIWIPETRVANEVYMEPITGIEVINKQRWKLRCTICSVRSGCSIQCAKSSCFIAFHPTCARKEKLLLPMKTTQGAEPPSLTAYCERHLPPEHAQAREKALESVSSSSETEEQQPPSPSDTEIQSPRPRRRNRRPDSSSQAHSKTYHAGGPPLVPHIIVTRLLTYIDKVKIRKKQDFVLMCCRYWSLKRDARRGAPLLKRLHLEPWSKPSGVEPLWMREMKLEQLKLLRADLQQLQDLTQACRKREVKKLKQAEVVHNVLAQALFPHHAKLRAVFHKVTSHDQRNLFRHPVMKQDAPDYYDIVKQPICWDQIEEKIERHEYCDAQSFKDDINLVFTNAFLYNKPGSLYHKTATRLQTQASGPLAELDALTLEHHPPTINVEGETRHLGNLEPPLAVLELLRTGEGIRDEVEFEIPREEEGNEQGSVLEWLVQMHLGKGKKQPSPPPLPPLASTSEPDPSLLPSAVEPVAQIEMEEKGKTGGKKKKAAGALNALDYTPGFKARRRSSRRGEFEGIVEPQPSMSTAVPGAVPVATPLRGSPAVVEVLDKKSLFTHFETGWVLPEGSSRRRVERDKGTAKDPGSSTQRRTGALPEMIRQQEDGTIVVEQLDTPATRRQMRLEQKKAGGVDQESELSELSEEEKAKVKDRAHGREKEKGKEKAKEEEDEDSVNVSLAVDDEGNLPPGTLVWAKMEGYPWWPASVQNVEDPQVPMRVKGNVQDSYAGGEEEWKYAVQFFDGQNTWGAFTLKTLKLLGVNEKVDVGMQKPGSKRFQKSAGKVKIAYQQALDSRIA